MKKKIVLPTDFSENAHNAIKYAIELYKGEPCEFFIVHSYYLPGFNRSNLLSLEPTEKRLNEVKARAERNMEILKKQVCFYDGVNNDDFHFLNEFGAFNEVLKEIVEKEDIKLIIMGTRGETDDKNTILGSNAINAMEKVRNCPVFAIPANVVYKAPSEIVFPTSFKTHYKENELATLIEISRLTKAPIRVLYVQTISKFSKEQEENKQLLRQILGTLSFTFHELSNINVHEGVRCFAQSRESGMIAFINKKHIFFGSIFSDSMLRDLDLNANVPTLALHDLRH